MDEGGSLIQELLLVPSDPTHYRCERNDSTSRQLGHVFGGQVLAQSVLAAGASVADAKQPNSLHLYFLRAGDPFQPIDYQVEVVRDGRRLSTRSVTASQGSRAIATALVSFADTSGSVSHQLPAPPDPGPEALPDFIRAKQADGGVGPPWLGLRGLRIRVEPTRVVREPGVAARAEDSVDHIWLRSDEMVADAARALGTDVPLPLLHAALLAYMSDVMLLSAAFVAHGTPVGQAGRRAGSGRGLSLDQSIWFHDPVAADEWLMFAQNSPYAGGGRALCQAQVFDRRGRLVASTRQEGLITEEVTPVGSV